MTLEVPTVALALFVKDEFSDIAGWIAWHAALGVQTFFIYDDHSTDGTWEILQAISKQHDLRLSRTNPSQYPNLADRQREAYLHAIKECRNHVDWLGFLDGDEYLYLKHFDQLPEFLTHFPHADGIAFSWRIYGSSNRAVRPHLSTVEAFTKHSEKDFWDNQHIKSFVRPEKLGKHYFNPHFFDIPIERYAKASGKPLKTAGPHQEVEWSEGFIMHFICRSMEHYVQRIKRRLHQDLSDSTSYWNYFDRNEKTDLEPLRLVPQMKSKYLPIQQAILEHAVLTLRDLPITPDPTLYEAQKINRKHLSKTVKITSWQGTSLFYCPANKKIIHSSDEIAKQRKLIPVYGIVNPAIPEIINFFRHHTEGSNRSRNNRYDMLPMPSSLRLLSADSAFFTLSHPISRMFMSFLPKQENGTGLIEINRPHTDLWEKVTLHFMEDITPPFEIQDLPFMPHAKTSAYAVLNWLKTAKKCPDSLTFLGVFYNLSPAVQQEISNYVPGLLWQAT